MNTQRDIKAQLSIFLIIVVFIISIVVYLLSSSQQIESNSIETSEELSTTQSQGFENLKEEVDFCLEQTLRKALIISGYLGGYIYTNVDDPGKYEQFSNSVAFDYYQNEDRDLLSQLELNPSYLYSNSLFYHTTQTHLPPFEGDISYVEDGDTIIDYSRGIQEDYERFIKDQISSCLELSKYSEQGFSISFLDNSGILSTQLDDSTAIISSMDGEEGDSVTMMIGKIKYPGEVEEVTNAGLKVSFASTPFSSSTNPESITNDDVGITVGVEFQEEQVSATISFPVVLQDNQQQSISSISSSITLDNRIKTLRSLMGTIISQKEQNKSYDFGNLTLLSNVLNEESTYFRAQDGLGMDFTKTILEDENEYKRYIYTLIDNKQKIQGLPFLFNAVYENNAPYIDLSHEELGCSNINPTNYGNVFENETRFCNILIEEDSRVDKNLIDAVVDRQIRDNRGNIEFKEEEITTSSYYYKLGRDGLMQFRGGSGRTEEVVVGDGEATREYTFRFLVSSPENDDNEEARSCLNFENSNQATGKFPIHHNYSNQIFEGEETSTGNKMPYGYVLNSVSQKATLSVDQDCFTESGSFGADIDIIDSSGTVVDTKTISSLEEEIYLPQRSNNYKVSIQVTLAGDDFLENPFEMTIYPIGCMGPESSNFIHDPSVTFGSCCDMSALSSHSGATNHPRGLPSILKNSGVVFDETLQFGVNIQSTLPSVAPESTNIYEETSLNERISSVYEADVKATCGGSHPRWIDNIDQISSSTTDLGGTVDKTSHAGSVGTPSSQSYSYSFREKNAGEVCARAIIWENILLVKDTNGIFYNGGLSSRKDAIVLSAHSDSEDALPETFLCDNDWHGTNSSTSSWTSGSLPWFRGEVSRSKLYCAEGSISCSQHKNIETKGGICREARFDGTDILTSDLPTGAPCGYNIDDSNSTHNNITYFECDGSGSCQATTSNPITEEKSSFDSSYNVSTS